MTHWSIDIVRQSGWDLWVWVCLAASIVLLCYGVIGRVWRTSRGRISIGMILAGVGGTAMVMAVPPLHSAKVGLVWTFVLLVLLSATFYLNLREQLSAPK